MTGPDDELALAESSLRSALKLTADETEYLNGLDLAGHWRHQPAGANAWWGWMSLAVALAVFGAWWLTAPLGGQVLQAAAYTGLDAVFLRTVLMLGVSFGEAVFALTTSPSLTYSPWLLALIGVVLLAWPWSQSSRPHQQQLA